MRPSPLPLLLETGCGVVAGATLTIALVSMAAQVVFRYLIGSSLVWSEEVARYALIWSAMFGSAAAYQRGGHMALTVAVDLLPPPVAGLAYRLIHLIVIVFAGLVTWHGALLTMRNFERDQLSPALQIPIAWAYLAIPVGGILIAFAAALGLWRGLAPSRHDG
jgi:TRAP-type C4-dicarboxylate transport system permease small subunit